jgi:dienelactone hydrolase
MATRSPKTIEIPTGDAHPVRGDVYVPPGGNAHGVVVLCHGFTGYKTWGFLPFLADALRNAGMVAISLDMSHNGTFPDPDGGRRKDAKTLYVRPDLFEKNTLRREYDDMGHVIRFVADGGLAPKIKGPIRIGLFGHSRGGITATLNAIDHPEVAVLATWSTIDDPDRFSDGQKERWRRDGVFAFETLADGTRLNIGLSHLDDLEENHDFYLLRDRVSELKVPHLVVHGKADLAVPFEAALRLHEAEHHLRDKELLVLQTGHTFGLEPTKKAPVKKPPRALSQAVEETVKWFANHLREEVTT